MSASSLTGSVLILFRPGTITPQKLLCGLERIVNQSDDVGALLADPPVSHWVAAGTCLGLAVATVAQPALAPITAAALVCSNLPTLSRGIVELCTFRWKVASLYSVIMGTTLASGQFLAAGIMQATITGWHAWTNHRLRKVVRDLTSLSSAESLDELLSDDVPATRRERIQAGTVINVPAGTLLPFDGIVVRGNGDLDEHGVRGIPTPAHRSSGDFVFAGSLLLRGNLQVRVVAVDSKTRISAIRGTVHSLICEAVGNGGATPRGNAVAARFVPYTFATGSAALMVGDLTTLAAVLRPDFCTGPSLADRLGTLSGVSHLLHDGWLVRDCQSLDALARVNTIVVADTTQPPPTDGAIEVRVSRLTGVSCQIQLQELRCSRTDFLIHVRELGRANKHIAVVGDAGVLNQLADVDVVRISMTPEQCLGQPYADLIALHAQPQKLSDLLQVLRETRQPGRMAWTAILACNALAVTGAFVVGLTSLHVVALTNAGILAASLFYDRQIQKSNRLLSLHRLQQSPSPGEAFAVVPEEAGLSPPEVATAALESVNPRREPSSRPGRQSRSRSEPKGARQTVRSAKSESPVADVSLLTSTDKTSPHRSN